MSAASDREIADLDAVLLADGEDIELRRLITAGTSQMNVRVDCRAFVRNYGAEELVGGITQEQVRVTISPSEIIAANWPGPWTPSANEPTKPDTDRRVPRKNDKCVIKGKVRNIEVAMPIYVDNELVRINLRVLG
jgi:hypothetical protein